MEWEQSYTSSWRVFRVNRETWADGDLIADIDSASVTRTADGMLLESGSIEVTGELESDYYRIVMTAAQSGVEERVDVATLLFDITGGDHNFGRTAQDMDGYSVLYPASKASILAGEYAPAGANGAEYAKNLLESSINAPVEAEGEFVLGEHIVHEIGSSVLEAVWAVLDAGSFVIQIDGRGVVHIRPMPTEPDLVLDSSGTRLMSNGIDFQTDISDVPNRYVVIEDENITIAMNDDAASPISTVNRGYVVDMVDESPTPVNGETLADYAVRRLEEESILKDTRTYAREYTPDVYLYSLIRASIDGLEGDYRVESQTISCSHGIELKEKASREVKLW